MALGKFTKVRSDEKRSDEPKTYHTALYNKLTSLPVASLLAPPFSRFTLLIAAFSHNFGSEFAVKQVNLAPSESKTSSKKRDSGAKVKRREVKSLRHEIELLKTFSHNNIVSYLGTEKTKKHLFVLMEFCAGGSVANAIKKWGALCEAVVRRYTVQILCGLCYLHSKKIAHRDIKPSNLLIHDGVVKLADFGTAKNNTASLNVVAESFTGGYVGTQIYMAPEVMMAGSHEDEGGAEEVRGGDERSDDLMLHSTYCIAL